MSSPRTILVVCALASELDGFTCAQDVEVVVCGVGPVEAAATTARALARGNFAALVNAGIAGIFAGAGRVGDAFAVGEETLADLGLEGGGRLTLPDGAQLAQHARASTLLVQAARDASLPVVRGVTVTSVTTTDATARRLRETYGAEVESMEGFAVLRAAELAGIPAIEVRGISNIVGDRAQAQWDVRAGSCATVRALAALLAVLPRALHDGARA